MKMKLVKIATILCIVIALAGPPALASITPAIDGHFDPGEGYTKAFQVRLEVQGRKKGRKKVRKKGHKKGHKKGGNVPADDGTLWLFSDPVTGDLFANFTQPLILIDNSYGANAIGWGKHVAPSGKDHKFRSLKGSDRAQFTITDGAENVVFDFTMDYISDSDSAPSGFASLGATGGDGKVYVGSAASLLACGTSLDYNFNTLGYVLTEDSPATDEDYTENPDFPGWVFEVTYEFRIDGSLFADNGFGGFTIPIVHNSPNKVAKNAVFPTVVPEPLTIGLFAFGALLIRRRKSR